MVRFMKRIFLLVLCLFIFVSPALAIEDITKKYNSALLNYEFKELSKESYKALSKEDKKKYKAYKKASKYYKKAKKYYLVNRGVKAIKYLDKAIKKDKLYINAYIAKADLLYDLQRYSESSTVYEKALSINKNIPNIYYKLGTSYFFGNCYGLSITNLDKHIKYNKNHNVGSYLLMAKANYNLHKHDNVLYWSNRMISKNLFLEEAYPLKAMAYFNKGWYKSALLEINRAIKLNPKDPVYFITRAECYRHLSQFKNTLKDLMHCKSLYLDQGNYDKARTITPEITRLNQYLVNESVKNITDFVEKPNWYKYCPKAYLDSLVADSGDYNYWAIRRENFFYDVNNCLKKYNGKNLCKCYESVNKEQEELTYKRNQYLQEIAQQAYLNKLMYIKSIPQQVDVNHNHNHSGYINQNVNVNHSGTINHNVYGW